MGLVYLPTFFCCFLWAKLVGEYTVRPMGIRHGITTLHRTQFILRESSSPRNRTHRTHVSRTPKKPEYLIARSQLSERGPLGFGPIHKLIDPAQG